MTRTYTVAIYSPSHVCSNYRGALSSIATVEQLVRVAPLSPRGVSIRSVFRDKNIHTCARRDSPRLTFRVPRETKAVAKRVESDLPTWDTKTKRTCTVLSQPNTTFLGNGNGTQNRTSTRSPLTTKCHFSGGRRRNRLRTHARAEQYLSTGPIFELQNHLQVEKQPIFRQGHS